MLNSVMNVKCTIYVTKTNIQKSIELTQPWNASITTNKRANKKIKHVIILMNFIAWCFWKL